MKNLKTVRVKTTLGVIMEMKQVIDEERHHDLPFMDMILRNLELDIN